VPHSPVLLAAGAFLVQFMVQGAWGSVPVFLSETSPGPVRATFPGVVYQLGNLIASYVPTMQGRIAQRVGRYGPVLGITIVVFAVAIAVVTSFARESRGAEITT